MGRRAAQLLLLPLSVMVFPPTLCAASEHSLNNPPNLISRGPYTIALATIALATAHPEVGQRIGGPMGAMRFSPGCLKWKFIKVRVPFLKVHGFQVRVAKLPGSSEVLRAEGVSKQRCCVPTVVSVFASDFLRRAPGKWHFPKCAARSEMLAG